MDLDDLLWCFFGYRFDLDPTFGGDHDQVLSAAAIEQY